MLESFLIKTIRVSKRKAKGCHTISCGGLLSYHHIEGSAAGKAGSGKAFEAAIAVFVSDCKRIDASEK
ncbi:MAG: hypothetical protein K2N90_00165 [Lachnospiraceae bacterium]|nr:hypothetical protein [Lachnospiraceae bacterium]